MKKNLKRIFISILVICCVFAVAFLLRPGYFERKLVKIFSPMIQYFTELPRQGSFQKYRNTKPVSKDVWGIDISHHQGKVEWNAFDNTKPHFAFLKATEGISFTDDKYNSYAIHFRDMNVPVGAYHFFRDRKSTRLNSSH